MTVTTSTTVTLVSAVRVRPGRDAEHATPHAAAVEEAERLGGLVRW